MHQWSARELDILPINPVRLGQLPLETAGLRLWAPSDAAPVAWHKSPVLGLRRQRGFLQIRKRQNALLVLPYQVAADGSCR